MKKLTYLLFIGLMYSAAALSQDKGKAKDDDDDDHGRVNHFPGKGNVGINIGRRNIASEKLEVVGNVKVSGTIFTQALKANSIESGSLLLFNNAVINGRLGIGISAPSEALDVAGNIKSSAGLFSSSLNTGTAQLATLSVAQNSIFSGLVGIGITAPAEKLHVGGNLKVDGSILSNSFNSTNLTAEQFTSGVASFTDNISVAKNALVTGKVGIGVSVPTEALDVNGSIKLTGGITGSSINAGNATLSQSLNVGGNSIFSGNLLVNGTFSANSLALNNVNTNENAIIGQNLKVNGNSQLIGDLTVGGNITSGIITASEFRTTNGSSAFNFTNALISQTLAVATAQPVPSNYKLAVGGAIIATGIDIKIPSKWPDYVFEEGYHLMSLSELNQYIKKHNHLPALPSAKEMKSKEVYSLSEMDTKLLEKVEELTLYILQLEKRIQELEKGKLK